ncbi:hypothetical protein OAU50_02170 [Planctomycetota bacterium]|nr:hypothetical protein [Planctomycetota bacterium]
MRLYLPTIDPRHVGALILALFAYLMLSGCVCAGSKATASDMAYSFEIYERSKAADLPELEDQANKLFFRQAIQTAEEAAKTSPEEAAKIAQKVTGYE